MALDLTHVPGAAEVDRFEDLDLRKLLKLFLLAFRSHVQEVQRIAPAYQVPSEVVALRDAVQEIKDKYDGMRG